MIVDDLRQILGDQAKAFFVAFAGREIYIPQKPDRTHSISLEIGWEAARRLAAVFGGETIYVPSAALREVRDREILAELEAGGVDYEVARRHRLSHRRIRQLQRRKELGS